MKGLRPFLAALFSTEKVPKPTSVSRFPFFSVFVTPSINEFNDEVACTLVIPASSADDIYRGAINCALFISFRKFINYQGRKFIRFLIAAIFF